MNVTHRTHLTATSVLLLTLALALLLVSTPALAAPPANDDFDTPTVISALTYHKSINTLTATTAADDPSCFGNGASVWYAFTPDEDMRIEADTYYSYYDTTLSVYTGERGSLTQIACNDDVAGSYYYSAVAFDATAGVTYYFMVAAYGSGTGGSAYLNVYHVPWPPANDTIGEATPITVPFSGEIDTTGATASPDDPVCIGSYDTVWYIFTAPETGYLHATVADNEYSIALSAYSGTPGDLAALGCSYVGYGSFLRFPVTGGETVYLMVTNLYNQPGETMTLTIEAGPPPPVNDDFSDATLISTLPYTSTVDTTYATGDDDDPECYSTSGTVWYAYNVAGDTRLDARAYTLDGEYSGPVVLGIYKGEQGSLEQIHCSYSYWGELVRIDAPAGETYYFMVGMAWGYTGREIAFTLHEAPPPPPNDDFDNATVIPEVPYSNTMNPFEATTAADDPQTCHWNGPARTVWYAFTASSNQWIYADTAGSNYDITLAAYTGLRGSLTMVSCAAWNGDQPLRFPVIAGQTYYFMVSVLSDPGTLLTFNLSEAPPPPANDEATSATIVSSLPYTGTLDTTTATSIDDPWTCDAPAATVWYRFTPVHAMRVKADSQGSDYSAILSFFSGAPGSLTSLNCGSGQVEQELEAGKTYYVMVSAASWSWAQSGNLVFHLHEALGPVPNDDFDHPTLIPTLPFSDNVDASLATWSADDPTSCTSDLPSIWYAFTPARNMTLQSHPGGGNLDVFVSVYTGVRGNLSQVACHTDFYDRPLLFNVQGGVTYYFMVTPWDNPAWVAFKLEEHPLVFLPFLTRN
jgi:hypothetical protein